MEYLKIVPQTGLIGIVKLTKYEGIRKVVNYSVIDNVIQSIWCNNETIKFYRYKTPNVVNIWGEFTVEKITQKEYYDIVNVLKERRIIDRVEEPKEPYMLDRVNSTNTLIRFVPKIGFEVGYRKVYALEWFNSMGAAYPMPRLEPFVNTPYEIKVDTKKYKGYRFVPEESTTEKSVYKIIWPSKAKFKSNNEYYYL